MNTDKVLCCMGHYPRRHKEKTIFSTNNFKNKIMLQPVKIAVPSKIVHSVVDKILPQAYH